MKKLIMTCIAATTLSLGSYAYGHDYRSHGELSKSHYKHNTDGKFNKRHHSGFKHMAKALALTEQQVSDIKALYAQAREERSAHGDRKHSKGLLMLDPSAADYVDQVAQIAKSRSAQTEQRIIERGELQAKVYALLTPEQQDLATAWREKRQQRLDK